MSSPGRLATTSISVVVLAAFLSVVPSGIASGTTVLEPGFVETQIAVSPEIRAPSAMRFGPDGRLYVLEQNRGAVRIVQNDVLLSTPLISLPVQTGGSRGLIGIAFHPNFNQNGFFYLNYTTDAGGFIHNRISRFTAVGNTANPNTEVVIWDGLDLEDKTMHYGGDIDFGPDGKLFVSTGDRLLGANGQNLNTTWGKMLRINPDGTIPSDNPFFAQTTGQNRAIWALGLRNPFKFTFQRGTGRLFIGDVGGDDWEEINQGAPGANFGWSTFEGPTNTAGFTSPLFAYNHNTGDPTGCAVMGGDFYNPNVVQFPPEFVGTYIFPDHCQGWLKSLDFAHGNQLRDILGGLENPVDVKVDPNTGALYYLERVVNGAVGGGLFRIDYRSSIPLQITQQPQSQTVAVGGSATFTVSAQGSPPLSYQWQRNGVNIAGATSATFSLANVQPSDSGSTFRVRVTNPDGNILSGAATLTVNSNHVPVPSIAAPSAGTTYVAGQQMTISGSASDQEDGPDLPASAFSWEVVFHHHAQGTPNAHTHPELGPVSGTKSFTWTIPNDNEVEADVWYRIHLTVTDSNGASTEVVRDVLPRTSQITLSSSPAGMQLMLDDHPVTSPTTVTGVEGILRRIEAPSPQTVGGQPYVFQGWSDGGAALRTITTPTADTTYTATFVPASGTDSALFVTGDTANLGTDQAVIDRLQQLGFVVTVISDDLVQASSTAGQDVVVASSSVDSVAVSNKLRDVTVPVIIWKPSLYDNMRMTGAISGTDFGTASGSTVNIQATQHPLAPNGAQTLSITNAGSTLPWGLPVGGADVIGLTGGRASLFAFSPGDPMLGNVPAPACRVAFPLYAQAIARYTAAGWDLFDRTILWMTDGGCLAQAPLAITGQPVSTTVGVGQTATFSVAATGSLPLTYQWRRDGVDIPGAMASSYSLQNAQLSDDGAVFRVRVTDPSGSILSDPATLTVQAGSGSALFVTGSTTSLGSDQTVVDRLQQQLGFVVTVIDDSAVQASSAAGHDLVLISSSADAASVGNKLRGVSMPVIIWKPALYDNMLMTGTTSGTDFGTFTGFRTLDVQAIAHPLAPNGAETIALFTVNSTIPFGLPVATADVVGRTGGRATLFTFSPGDVMRTGVAAPACRVAFPLYRNAIPRLTAAGWDLFERTVDWATTGCAAP